MMGETETMLKIFLAEDEIVMREGIRNNIAWQENIYQVKAEYRAYEVLNGTYRRVAALPEAVLQVFITCDVETAKIINLIAILLDGIQHGNCTGYSEGESAQ